MLPQPILVVPKEETNSNDFIWTTNIPIERVKEIDKNYSTQKGYEWLFTVHGSRNQYKSCEVKAKIIAGIPELPSIDFSALSEEDCKKIGWIDVKKLADKESDKHFLFCKGEYLQGFIEGFKTGQYLSDKKFSEEELLDWIEKHKYTWGIYNGNTAISYEGLKNFIQFLFQPKVFDVEVEMEDFYDEDNNMKVIQLPKITNNSIKITKVL